MLWVKANNGGIGGNGGFGGIGANQLATFRVGISMDMGMGAGGRHALHWVLAIRHYGVRIGIGHWAFLVSAMPRWPNSAGMTGLGLVLRRL